MSASLALDARELGAVLAGLRVLQEAMDVGAGALPEGLTDIISDGGTVEPLSLNEIDRLAERLNAMA